LAEIQEESLCAQQNSCFTSSRVSTEIGDHLGVILSVYKQATQSNAVLPSCCGNVQYGLSVHMSIVMEKRLWHNSSHVYHGLYHSSV